MSFTQQPEKALELFYSYAHEDQALRDELEKHLSNLKRQGHIFTWHDRDISAGMEWASVIDERLNQAHIILLLISPDFMASDYCYSIEMARALERHNAGEARVIPIILRPVDWEDASFSELQALPEDGKPVSSSQWHNLDEAFLTVVKGIRKAIKELSSSLPAVLSSSTSLLSKSQEKGPPLTTWTTWNVPFRRNPFFTGREQLLAQLHDKLTMVKNAALTQSQAISGLGGIGKTQIAVEFAYRYRNEYHYVLWVRAVTRDVMIADFVALANLLQLPEKDEQDQHIVVAAVKRWLAGPSEWLLILDNVDDIIMVDDFLPTACNGHVLLTTRAQATGAIAEVMEVEKMNMQEGALLLLRRARLLPADASLEHADTKNRAWAEATVNELDGLPLALDQAGAYIEETRCGLLAYLDLYRTHRKELLKRRSTLRSDHPESVATTWSLSFQQIERAHPAAADLLRLCAFLDPDVIPEEMITEGASELGPVLQTVAADAFRLNSAIEELRKFSLVKRNSDEKMLRIHRLVQAVLKDGMDEEIQHQWAERTVRVVNQAFPDTDVSVWSQCRRYLPQAQRCANLIDDYGLVFPQAARLLNEAGCYLREHAQYIQAEQFLRQALATREKALGTEHSDTGATLNNLAYLYDIQGRYAQAEPLYQQALAIQEKTLGAENAATVMSLLHLESLYRKQGRYTEAEPLFQQALVVSKNLLEQELPDTAIGLNNLALLFFPGKDLFSTAESSHEGFERAESLLLRALAISEKVRGPEDITTDTILLNLGFLYTRRGLYKQAEASYQRALAIREKVGYRDPRITTHLHNLAQLYQQQRQYAKAESLLQRALTISEQNFDPIHPNIASSLSALASCYAGQRQYAHAEPLLQRALMIQEQVFGSTHINTANSLSELALCYQGQKQYTRAEPLLQRALAVYEQVLGHTDPPITMNLIMLAIHYDVQNRYAEAEPFYQRALSIWEKTLKPEQAIVVLDRFIDWLQKLSMEEEANALEVRAKAIQNK